MLSEELPDFRTKPMSQPIQFLDTTYLRGKPKVYFSQGTRKFIQYPQRKYKHKVKAKSWNTSGGMRMPRPVKSNFSEMKYLDNAVNSTVDATTALVLGQLCGIPNGNQQGQRVGNVIRVRAMHVTLEFENGAVSTGSAQNVCEEYRIILVQYSSGNSNGDPGVAAYIDQDQLGHYSPNTLRNVEQLSDFRPLLDKKVKVNAYLNSTNTLPTTSQQRQTFQFKVDCNFIMKYNGTNGNQVVYNPIFGYILNNTPHPAAGDYSKVYGTIRTIYSDV